MDLKSFVRKLWLMFRRYGTKQTGFSPGLCHTSADLVQMSLLGCSSTRGAESMSSRGDDQVKQWCAHWGQPGACRTAPPWMVAVINDIWTNRHIFRVIKTKDGNLSVQMLAAQGLTFYGFWASLSGSVHRLLQFQNVWCTLLFDERYLYTCIYVCILIYI